MKPQKIMKTESNSKSNKSSKITEEEKEKLLAKEIKNELNSILKKIRI
jgi:flagellar basal body-associated protein FliL